MNDKPLNIHDAKTRLSQLLARAERGQFVVIACDGKPVAQLGPLTSLGRPTVSPDDPLLNLGQFAVEGPGGAISNEDIDRLVHEGK